MAAPVTLARAGNAMLHGYTLERMLDPAGVPEDLIESMFELLVEPGGGPDQQKRDATPRRRPSPASGGAAEGERAMSRAPTWTRDS